MRNAGAGLAIAVFVLVAAGSAAQPVQQHAVIGKLAQFDLAANVIAIETLGRTVETIALADTTFGWWKANGSAPTVAPGSIVLVIFRQEDAGRVALVAHSIGSGPVKRSEGVVTWFQPASGTLILKTVEGREEVYRIQSHAFVDSARGGSRVTDDSFKSSDRVRVYFTSEGTFSHAHMFERVDPAQTTP